MTRGARLAIGVVVLAGVAGAAWLVAPRVYLDEAARLRDRIETARTQTEQFEDALAGGRATARALEALRATTFAGDEARVQHLLRTGLAGVAAEAGLGDVSVSSGNARALGSPAGAARLDRGVMREALRRDADFAVIEASVSGSGTLEQAVRALALAQSQPWLHRVEGFQIRPAGEGGRVAIRIDAATLFFGGEAGLAEAAVAPAGREASARVGAVRGPGACGGVPDPEPVVRRPEPPPAPPPAPAPAWRVAAVVMVGGAPEVWCVEARTGERRVLRPSETIAGAELLGAEGESARFRAGDVEFQVVPGQAIAPPGS